MTSTLINRRDLDFVLHEFLDVGALCTRPRFAEHGRETFDAVLDTAYAIAEDHFATHAHEIDEHEPSFDGERVHVLPAAKAALDAYIEAGFPAATHDAELGGMQLPYTVFQACAGLFTAANVGTAGYAFLSGAAANPLAEFATEEQKARYLTPLLEGRFFGTMVLTEPHAGSSLGDLRTSAVPAEDGSYRISGSKIFISAGDHELSENIVHLVLARIQGAPAGVKGISLFIVPKYRLDENGDPGARNDVALAGLIHKMGYRGTTSTMLNFGEQGDCHGYLLGAPNQGLACMFHMMNEARVGVGLGAAVLGYSGYLHALDYARNRPQGRPPAAKDPDARQVPIVEHADVRRMLLAQKAYAEGGLALCLYAARLVDDEQTSESDEARARAKLLLDMLTPVVKSWPSQWCLEANSLAIQVHGGYGYTREYPVERLYRDNRLNPIHEGTHGIQAMDLLGRKMTMKGGAGAAMLFGEIAATIAQARDAGLDEQADAMDAALTDLRDTTATLTSVAGQDVTLFLANATPYMEAMGHLVVGWIWLKTAVTAQANGEGATGTEADFYAGKLAAGRYFHRWELPRITAWTQVLRDLDRTCLDMKNEWF